VFVAPAISTFLLFFLDLDFGRVPVTGRGSGWYRILVDLRSPVACDGVVITLSGLQMREPTGISG